MIGETRTALVTGAGSGIGRGCALALATAGYELVINDRPGSSSLAETAEILQNDNRPFHVVEADVFSREGRERMVSTAIQAGGGIDILVSNPALNLRRPFLEMTVEDFENVVAGTLTSGFHVSQLVARGMADRGNGGRIVFISSVHANMPFAENSAYNAAKAGLNHMARTMSVELAPHRITVNTIEPGWIDTPGERAASSDEFLEREALKLPWRRMGTPKDVAAAAVFLASDEAEYITGTCIAVDGGFRFKDCRTGESEQI